MVDSNGIRAALSATNNGVSVRVKVVPGSSRDRVGDMLADRLKINVAAPPEEGKANKAVCSLLAKQLGVPKRDVTVIDGPNRPTKTVHVDAVDVAYVLGRLGVYADGSDLTEDR